jgi:hypothetical protein
VRGWAMAKEGRRPLASTPCTHSRRAVPCSVCVNQAAARLSDALPGVSLSTVASSSTLIPGLTAGALLAFLSSDVVIGGITSSNRGVRLQV